MISLDTINKINVKTAEIDGKVVNITANADAEVFKFNLGKNYFRSKQSIVYLISCLS